MSNSDDQTPGSESPQQSPDRHSDQARDQQWEAAVRSWLSALPEGRALSAAEVEAWVASNHASLPEDLRSLPPSQLCDRFLSIQDSMGLLNQETDTNQADFSHARFQRTDQWIPVYSWLESLDKDEVVKSKEISDWLSDNPKIREQLCLRHSRYHLMHYIKKCHLKILKRRDKKKEPQHSNKTTPVKVQKPGVVKQPVIQPCNAVNNLPKDSDIYLAKRNEALHKYEILVELEEQLSTIFAKQ
ncbi:uncharacterized protein LOC131160579 isoform X3 [Malania oleifera]|uniref:uncharacterized protein LOC131160579 isoform X3 n=1 Tax=Malania oleifera TaxID=397392 RepID=UPI0025ADA3C2|nr:uncharacterized protein LOC131160579 isoform X3 [Malania oleifera]